MITDNPFHGQHQKVGATDRDTYQYVEAATIGKLIDNATGEWQVILALTRFNGLRCPSELVPRFESATSHRAIWPSEDRIILHMTDAELLQSPVCRSQASRCNLRKYASFLRS